MKLSILILAISIAGCCSTNNKTASAAGTNAGSDSAIVTAKLPACVKDLVRQFEAEKVQNPPRKIYSYTYKSKTVYYVPAICCDFFSDLYDDNCKLIGHPDGGFTGRGDGKMSDFDSTKTNEVLLWQDKRKG